MEFSQAPTLLEFHVQYFPSWGTVLHRKNAQIIITVLRVGAFVLE